MEAPSEVDSPSSRPASSASSPVSAADAGVSCLSASGGDVALDDSLYSWDVKEMRYMSISAFFKASLHCFVSVFSSHVRSASALPLPSSLRAYSVLDEALQRASENEEEDRHRQANSGSRDARSRDSPHKNERFASDWRDVEGGRHLTETDEKMEGEPKECGGDAGVLVPLQRHFSGLLQSLSWPYGGDQQHGEADTEHSQKSRDNDPFGDVLPVEQLALVDAGVYVRPNLSELLAGLNDDNQMQNLLNRCKAIDEELARLEQTSEKKQGDSGRQRASTLPLAPSPGSLQSHPLSSSSSLSSSPSSLSSSLSVLGTSEASRFRAAAVSAERAQLRAERRRLEARQEQLRSLASDLWGLCGLDIQRDRVSLEDFLALFCSNLQSRSQVREAETLFRLCQRTGSPDLSFEDMLLGLPTRAYEVIFVVREMKKKSRQSFRYFWI
ncbi:hypothetical protein TGVEG_201740 [Toxoplasma gondii VEG]|uniref:Uncharacterized protein n=1 Tax=Toxoplasma gondii (strain ATCC 50861 / VEG) TaxID=432359 RepID=B9QG24_TOXGV|nr:hypothetical protein TGVEG_201740 [Toxoplasma gondii VEG]CEL73952.1 TPA: hypothetical protein BN1205_047680 [Toxoplasma gondii VEG]